MVVEGILIGILGNGATAVIANLIKKIDKNIYEDDPIINKTYQALERAYKIFFDKYKKQFGAPNESFLARLKNQEVLLRRIYFDSKKLSPGDLVPDGYQDAPRATEEALAFLIETFETELANDRELLKEIDIIKHHRQTDEMKHQLDNIATVIGEQRLPMEKTPPLTLLTPLPPRKIHLIGRENDLAALAEMLKKSERVVLVNGLGGIGKTEVCKSFFYSHYNQYDYAAWIDWISSLKESLVNALGGDDSQFIQPGEKESVDERFKKIKAGLQHMRETFLLVVDNIENPGDADLDALAALPSTVKVLVNSRSFIEGYEVRNLDYLSAGECRALFYEFYKSKRDDETVDNIVALSGYHTLTVELLAKTAFHAGMSIQKLYETLKLKGFNLNEVAGETVATVWHNEKEKKRFFDHLVKVFDISGVTEEELSVLVNLSILPAVYIPMAWVRDWLKLKDNNLVTSLVEKGWIKRDGVGEETRLYLHPVMQEVVKYRAKPDAQKCKELIHSLTRKLKVEPGDNPILKKEYILYGESVVRALAMELEEKDEDLATLANNLSMIYKNIGQLDRALEFQLKTIDIFEAVLGKNHPNLATSYNNVSTIYKDMGQLDRALESQLNALAIREAVLAKNHPDLATSYNNVSMIYNAMGQLDRALEFQVKTIEILESVLDKQHQNLASAYNNLSLIYQAMGQLNRALEFQLKALAIREAVLAKNHPSLATSYSNISTIYETIGKLESALEFQNKALQIREEVLAKNHPDLATSYHIFALIYKDMGQLDWALEFQLKALAILEVVLAKNHPDLATSYNNVSLIYQDMGQLDQALEFQLKALAIREAVLAKNHPSLATSYNNLSTIYKDMGQLERALEFQLKALAIREAVLAKNHPSLATSYNNLSTFYFQMGDYTSALAYAEKAVAILQQLFPSGHPDLDVMKRNLEIIKENRKRGQAKK